MDVLFSVLPGHGHFFPHLPLARALAAAGHRVRVASSGSYGPTIRAHGFEPVAVGPDRTLASAGGSGDPADRAARLMEKMFVEGPPAVLDSLVEVMAADRPDVAIVDTEDHGGRVAAERLEVPAGSVVNGVRAFALLGRLALGRPAGEGPAGYRAVIRGLRERAGVPEPDLMSHELPHDRTLNLCQAPPSLEAWPHDWLSHTSHPLRPEPYSTGDPEPWLDEMPRDRPLVAVTLGTLFGAPEVYGAVVRGALATGARVIATAAGPIEGDEDRLVTVPWVSMDRLMETADAVVHHAGWGSTIAALASGTPAVAVPLGADQPATAARLHSAGAALAVQPGPSLEAGVRAAVGRVLEEAVFRLNAERLRREIEAMPAAPEVVPLVEELAATGGPVLNRRSG